MNDDALTDAEIEALFGPRTSAALDKPLERFVSGARSVIGNIEAAQPSPALLEFIDVSAPPIPIRITTAETEVIELIEIDPSGVLHRSTKRRAISAAATFALIGGLFVSAVATGPGLPGFGPSNESGIAVGSSTSSAVDNATQDAAQDPTKDSAPGDDFNTDPGTGSTFGQGVNESSSTQQGQDSSATSGPESTGLAPTETSTSSTSGTQPSTTTSSTSTSSSSTSSTSTSSSSTSSSSTSSTSTSSSSTSVPATVANQSFLYSVTGVGSVTASVVDGYVAFSGANPQPGWTVEEQHTDGIEAEIRFTDGEARVRLSAEVEDGLLRVTVRDDRNDDDQSDASFDGGQPVTGNITQTPDSDDPDSDDSDSDDPDSDDSDSDDPDSDDSDSDDPDSDDSGSGNSGSGKSPDDSD